MKNKIILISIIIALIAITYSIPQRQSYQSVFKNNPEAAEAEGIARILFVGDMMFDRTIRSIANENGYNHLFSCITDYLHSFDLVIGNLEGPITEMPSSSLNTIPGESGNTTFTFDRKVAKILADYNINMVNLGNNHILDFGRSGITSTQYELTNASVKHFGAPGDAIYATTTVGGRVIGIVNFNQFLGENKPSETIEAIWRADRSSDFVAVYTHWGDEYLPATQYEKSLAHSFIDAGADVVIGSHPHIIQEVEKYNGKNIYYSLGNFVFDQYFSDEVKTGAGVEIIFDGNEYFEKKVTFDIRRDGTVCLKN